MNGRKVGDKVTIKVEATVTHVASSYDRLVINTESGHGVGIYSDIIEKAGGKIKAVKPTPKPTNRQLFDALPVGTRFRVGAGVYEFAKTGEGTFLRKNRRSGAWEPKNVNGNTWKHWELGEGSLRADGTL